jgi:hypothetical protein
MHDCRTAIGRPHRLAVDRQVRFVSAGSPSPAETGCGVLTMDDCSAVH